VLGDQLRLLGAVAIARRVEGDVPHGAADRLVGVTVASVGGSRASAPNVVGQSHACFATEVDVHLGVEHAFERGLHQGSEQTVDIVERLGFAGDLAGELLGLELEGRVHASISVRKEGYGIYPNRVPDTSFLTGPEIR